ncbi:aminotransferase class V-fold PLP-dependent enzyme [Iocasia frigidifontis]|uniref:Aminotransferase class V-fold PLP-dependent enzyme n=1 Tax=Iocasia fonsfrigidae TaxID=2682810 RepID=A0A8A7KCD0_9FIRM|nr:cysteine desulfurase family protein [Iocasia fonsfrigidae]QTL99513.1 aminotransferase class V-fold PLP-dependent enzyme [Iocasia fonsfrigidae]
MQEVYLDNSATTKPLTEVIDYVSKVLTNNYGNPSSLHNKGLAAEKIIKEARNLIAAYLKTNPEEIYFTSGGTEANNLAIRGVCYNYSNRGKHIITTEVEHPSVKETFLALEEEGYEVTFLKADQQGYISIDKLVQTIREDTILVSIIHVNNELGTIHSISKIAELIKKSNSKTFFHVDTVQSFGKVLLLPADWGIDLLTISAHKIHGPKGIGALYVKKGIDLKAQIIGGGQENGLRSGTENVPGIAGFIPALKKLPEYTVEKPYDLSVNKLKNYFIEKITQKCPTAHINSPQEGAPHIVSISFPGARGEVLVHGLESEGVFVSTGSACHSKSHEKSHVLRAIKLPPEKIDGTIRISFSRYNTRQEINYAISKISEQLKLYF